MPIGGFFHHSSLMATKQYFAIVRSLLKSLQQQMFAFCKTDLSRGSSTRSHGVLDHRLNLSQKIPFMSNF